MISVIHLPIFFQGCFTGTSASEVTLKDMGKNWQMSYHKNTTKQQNVKIYIIHGTYCIYYNSEVISIFYIYSIIVFLLY